MKSMLSKGASKTVKNKLMELEGIDLQILGLGKVLAILGVVPCSLQVEILLFKLRFNRWWKACCGEIVEDTK